MKYRFKRMMSMALVMIMVFSSLSSAAYAATGEQAENFTFEPEEPTVHVLQSARLAELEGQESVYFGTATADLEEKDRYFSIPIYREGDLSTEASVSLLTLDVSAGYGEDYELVDENVYVSEQEQTMLEKGNGNNTLMSEEEMLLQQEKLEQAYEQLDEDEILASADSDDAGEADEADEADDAGEAGDAAEEEDEEEPEYGDLTMSVLESLDIQIGDDIDEEQLSENLTSAGFDYSSGMVIHFAEGESEKTVVFHIMDDEEEEGQEMFMFVLADAENTVIRKQYSFTAVIEDNEELHDSVISFSEESYESEKGRVTVTVTRTGSEYAMIDFYLKSCQDTAIPGENYEEFNQLIKMQPYQTEAEYTFDVSGQGRMEVLLVPETSCEEGECVVAEVLIDVTETEEELNAVRKSEKLVNSLCKSAGLDEKESYWQNVEIEESETEGTDNALGGPVTFDIYNDGKKYTVKYQVTETAAKVQKGTIIDPDYQAQELVVGEYYFTSDEFFKYNLRYGYDSPREVGSKYEANAELKKAYGHLWWYTKTHCRTGGSFMESKDYGLNTIYFSKVVPDWAGLDSTGWWHQFRWRMFSESGGNLEARRNHKDSGKFTRTADESVKRYIPNSWPASKVKLAAYAEDNGDSRNYNNLAVYGFAFFYKKYSCKIVDYTGLDFKTAQGGTLKRMLPVDLSISSGVNKGDSRWIYLNQDGQRTALVFKSDKVTVNGETGIFGTIESWDIIYAMNKAEAASRTVHYPADFIKYLRGEDEKAKAFRANSQLDYSRDKIEEYIKSKKIETVLTTIDFDTYFAEYLQYLAYCFEPDGNVGDEVVQLGFSPHIVHKTVKVKLFDPEKGQYGKFTDTALAVRDTAYDLNAGDTYDLSVTATKSGQIPEGYQVSYDRGIKWDTITSTNAFTIPSTDVEVWLRPVFSQEKNHIEITYLYGAGNVIEVQGVIPADVLAGTDFKGRKILDINSRSADLTKRMKPELGEIYTLEIITKQAAPEGYVYRPYFVEDPDATNPKKIYAQAFPVVAKGNVSDNFYYVGVDLVKEDTLKTYTISGNVYRQQLKSKVVTADPTRNDPANDTLIITSGKEVVQTVTDSGTKEKKEVRYVEKLNTSTNLDGVYTLTGVPGRPGEYIAIQAATDLNNGEVAYVQLPADGSTSVTAKSFTVTYPYSAPEVVSVNYTYKDIAHTAKQDTTSDNIYIYDDTINFSVVINEKQRKAGEVYLITYHTSQQKSGDLRRIPLTRQKKLNEDTGKYEDTDVWTAEVDKMNRVFLSGDRLYVSIVDAEQRAITTGNDEAGKPVIVQKDLVYPVMDTGLKFTETLETPNPQWYQATMSDPSSRFTLPVLGGEGVPGATSGMLTFDRLFLEDDKGYVDSFGLGLSADMMGLWTKALRKNNFEKSVALAKKARAQAALDKYKQEYADLSITEKHYVEGNDTEKIRQSIADRGRVATDIGKREDELNDLSKTLAQNKEDAKKINKWLDNEKGLDTETLGGADITFAMALDYIKVKDRYIYASSQLTIGFTAWVDHSKFVLIACKVPGWFNIGGGLQLSYAQDFTTKACAAPMTSGQFGSITGNIAEVVSVNPGRSDAQQTVGANLYGAIGVGLKDVVGVAGCASLAWQGFFPVVKMTIPETATAEEAAAITKANQPGHILDFSGGFEITLLLIKAKLDIVRVKKGFGSASDTNEVSFVNGLGKKHKTPASKALAGSSSDESDASEEAGVLVTAKGNETLSIVPKHSGTSDMRGFAEQDLDSADRMSGDYAVSSLLLEDAADDTAIQTVQTDEKGSLFMVYVGRRDSEGDSDGIEKDALYWTNYHVTEEGEEGTWDEPQLLDPEGIYESIPDISMDDGHITVTWSSAEEEFESEDDYIGNLSKFRMKAAVFEIVDGKAELRHAPVFLSGKKATRSEAEKSEEKEAYMDVDGWTWFDSVNEKLYSLITRYDLSNVFDLEDIFNPEKLDPTVYYAEYEYPKDAGGEFDSAAEGELVDFSDISLVTGNTLLNDTDVEMIEIPQLDANGIQIGTRHYMALVYTQDSDGDIGTEEDNQLKLCLIEFADDGEDYIVYPSIDLPYTNGSSEYEKRDQIILGSGYQMLEEGEEYAPDDDLIRMENYTDDPDGDGEYGMALSNAEITEAGGTWWLTYLKDGYLFEMIDIGAYLEGLLGEEYLADMYRERALMANGGYYAVTPEEMQLDSGDGAKWYEVSVDDLNEAWDAYLEKEEIEMSAGTGKWFTLRDPESFDSLLPDTLGELEEASDPSADAEVYETSSAYAFTMGEFDSNETVLSRGGGTTTITDYQLVSNGKDIYIVYTDHPKDTLDPVTELYCIKKSVGYSEEEIDTEPAGDEEEKDTQVFYSEPVRLTNYGRVIGNFKASMEGDEITVISQSYDQWIPEESGIEFSRKDMIETRYRVSAMPRVQADTVDAEYFVNPEDGKQYVLISYEVANNGLETQNGYRTWVEDENSEHVFDAGKEGFLRSGDTDEYQVIVPIDSLTEEKIFTIVVADYETGDAVDACPAEVQPVTRTETEFRNVERLESGEYQAQIIVKNSGSVDTEATTMKLRIQNSDVTSEEERKVYKEFDVSALEPGESTEMLCINFTPAPEDFSDFGTIKLEAILEKEEAGSTYTYIANDPDMAVLEGGKESLTLSVGTKRQLTAVCEPFPELTGTVLYYSENPEVASVDSDGMLSLNKNGITTVYAYLPDLGYVDDISILVRDNGKDDKPDYEEHNVLASEMLPSYVETDGSWKLDGDGNWIYTTRAGVKAADRWMAIARSTFGRGEGFEWFFFDKDGRMVTGWFRDSDDRMYYLQVLSDGSKGRMLTGWQLIDGKWYYFEPESTGYKGSLYVNTRTRDGYTLGADGAWTGK